MITKYKIFEGVFGFRKGDIIIAKRDRITKYGTVLFKKGESYRIAGSPIDDDGNVHHYYVANEDKGRASIFTEYELNDLFYKRKTTRRITPEDPLGEEEWEVNEKIFNKGKEVYYTQTSVDPQKVKKLMRVIEDDWYNGNKMFFELNPVAFERFNGKLYLTEGHHRFEACLKLNNKEILDKLFETAYYYDITWKPKSFKKQIIKENLDSDLDPYGEDDGDEPKYQIGDKIDISSDYYAIIVDINPTKREYKVEYYKKITDKNTGWGFIDEYKIKGLLKENINSDIDPWNEEDWEIPKEPYKKGDKLISKYDVMTSTGKHWRFHKNQVYTIADVKNILVPKYLIRNSAFGHLEEFTKEYLDKYFTKVIQESIKSDIDPWNEEDWDVPCEHEWEKEKYFEYDLVDTTYPWTRERYRCKKCKKTVKKLPKLQESINSELDPWNEEDWNDYLSMLKNGDKFIVLSPMIVYKNRKDTELNKGDIIYYVGQHYSRRQNYTRYIFTNDITDLSNDCEFDLELDDFVNIKNIDIVNENMNETTNKMKVAMDFIKKIIKGTEWEGKVYVAGGAVRDEIMGNDPKDVDLLINVPDGGILFAEWITQHLGIYSDNNPIIYPRFGTAKFNLRKQKHNGINLSDVEVECVMPRKETYVQGDRNPEVSQGTLKDDVDRRDFTVNSLLKDLTTGEILDLTGMGIDDIKRGIVKTPLDPDVIFSEDPLRMLRAIRFTIKYNWDLPWFMIRSIKKNAKKLEYISSERVQDELNKMLVTSHPDKAIRLLQMTKLSKYIFPELDKLIKMKQNKFHKYDAMRHTLEVLKNTPPDLITRLAALFHDIGKAKTKEIIDSEIHFYKHEEVGSHMVRDIMKRLHYPKEIIEAVATAVGEHMRTKHAGDKGDISDRSLRKLKQDLGVHLQQTLDLIHADNISHSDDANMPNQISNIRRRFLELEEKDKNAPKKSPLNGDEIQEILGIGKGPIVGKILAILGDMYLDDPHMTKDELVHVVKKSYEELK